MMNRLIKCLGTCLSWLFPLSLGKRVRNMKAIFFTAYLKRHIGRIGQGSYIFYPYSVLVGVKDVSIGEKTSIGEYVQLTAWNGGTIVIGNGCVIRRDAHISSYNSILIGDNLLTGTNVLITDNSHGAFERSQLMVHPSCRPLLSKGPVVIGNNVWLGNNVCVLPGVTIGDGVVVGANSVVTHDLPAYSLAAGIPAKVIKQL